MDKRACVQIGGPIFCIAVVLAGLLGILGCSNQGKTALKGVVTYGGKPLALGAVTFTPKGDGFRAIQTVKDGAFDIAAKNGVQPGEYNVTVEGFAEVPEDDPDQVTQYLFSPYSTSLTVVEGQDIVIDVPAEE